MQYIYDQLRHAQPLTFLALIGKENCRSVYTFNLTYKEFVEFFNLVPYDEHSDLLLQRETQKSRINELFAYTQIDYAALPACGAIVEDLNVQQTAIPNVVEVTIPPTAFRYLFDGQGRRAGIEKLLAAYPEFGANSISIKAYKTEGVERDNQLFSDWNGASVKPNKSICQSMDSRLVINTFTKDILKDFQMQDINSRIDYTKASVTLSQSPKLWSLNQFNTVVQTLLGVTTKSAETLLADEQKRLFWKGFIIRFFQQLSEIDVISAAISSNEGAIAAKEKTVIGTAVWLKGMAVTGRALALHLMETTEKGQQVDWSFMKQLNLVDYSRDNPEWVGRCMDFRGRFQDKSFNHKAMAAFTLNALALPLPEELEIIEDEVLIVKSEQRKAEREAKQAEQQLVVAA